ncbi:ATP-binding protein [Actinoallomurus spadix]|uniref:IstB-like ATP-binding domain-containing protein n=1 Tax=Actinoallomurus spadix TaxID=79912 RepID=A0ABP3GN60_9ACTN|nr:ATP-binding protein [Actinoallomurus spadix]MCO5986552.1 ATP-binding protein [Actinoallomurus spadix]
MTLSEQGEPSSEIYQQWLAEDRERRLKLFYDTRPAAFADKGRLDPRVHEWLEAFIVGRARTLLLGGPTGVGKSWTAWKSIETLVHNGWRGVWSLVTGYRLSRLIAPPVDDEELDRLARVDLLVIDDLGSAPVTDWTGSHLGGLVDERWSHRRPSILTTNVQQIGGLVGPRAASRLADGMTAVVLDGPDRRRAAQ